MALVAGTKLGSYEIIAPLGAGGMGEVYRARDPVLKRDVAIKVLPAYWARDPERLRRFELEAQAAAALNHPHIVSIFHVGQHNGTPYIVTELLLGESLRDRLHRGPMRLREVLDVGVEIARGLGAAHDAGIVHRDLKPENLFLSKDGHIKILDFGLAKLEPGKAAGADGSTLTLRAQTSPGHVLGTVGYMSPEQVRGHAADPRSDIFAAGVILYEMLTGRRAFRKATAAETMTAILNEDPPAISQLAPSLPPGLQKVVNRCLAKTPEQRFQHASDLAFALEALSDSSSTALPALRPAVSGKRWFWLATAAILVTFAAAVILWWRQPPTVPIVEAVTQLTDDGEPKLSWDKLVTDGSRIYFNEGNMGSLKIAQVAVTGGPTAVIPSRLSNPYVVGLSPEGSALLVIAGGYGQGLYPLWQLPLPAGEPRRLGDFEAQDAAFFPDGRIVFARQGALFLAENDGSRPRQLVAVEGFIGDPAVSPDGQRIVFTIYSQAGPPLSIVETRADGSGLRPIVNSSDLGRVCCARWTADGRYIVFGTLRESRQDVWASPMKSGLLPRSRQPVPLTNGPLSYTFPIPSRDGKQVFVVGTKQRGQVVRYDAHSRQFVPFLSGMSAFNPTFSRDGKRVAYASYPDHTLWSSRSDGTDRVQLTFPRMQVYYPFISPDGKRVVYGNSAGEIYVVSTAGGPPQRVVEKDSWAANWSPDGNTLVFLTYPEPGRSQLNFLDLRSGQRSVVPGSQGLVGGQWVGEGLLVATPESLRKLLIFDSQTQRWSDLLSGAALETPVNWAHSPDYTYFYFTTGGTEPKALRVRLADRKVETIASLQDLPRAIGPDGNTQISVAPDGSAVFTRDIGTQEIYSLAVKWP